MLEFYVMDKGGGHLHAGLRYKDNVFHVKKGNDGKNKEKESLNEFLEKEGSVKVQICFDKDFSDADFKAQLRAADAMHNRQAICFFHPIYVLERLKMDTRVILNE